MTGDEPGSRLRLDERVALVTGANSPIGAAIARRGSEAPRRRLETGRHR